MSHAGTANPAESSRTPPPWWLSLGAGLLFTLTMILAFPPFSLWGLVFLAPIGLFYLGLNAGPRPGRAGLLAALGVLPFWLVQMRYINDITSAGYVPLAIWFSIFTWLFIWLSSHGTRRLPGGLAPGFIAVLWTAIDLLRGDVVFTGFPWYYLSHPLIDAPWLVRPATTVGAYGLTLLIAAAVCAIMLTVRPGSYGRRGAVVALGGALLLWCILSWPSPTPDPPRTVRAAMVQTNLPQNNKMAWTYQQRLLDFDRFEALTRQAAAGKPDLIAWPETMFPGHLDPQAVAVLSRPDEFLEIPGPQGPERIPARIFAVFAERLHALQAQIGIPIVVGAIGVDNFRIEPGADGLREFVQTSKFNSAFLITGGRVQTRYDKIALTPFGEVMPGIKYWPWLQHQVLVLAAQGMSFDLSAGTTPQTLDIPLANGDVLRMATPICFETTRGQFCRDLVFGAGGRRADVFVNLTNDGWFSTSDAGRRQHLQLARWRCLETGTPMLRSANTGVSAVIDERGRLLAKGVDGASQDTNIDGVLSYSLQFSTIPTFFARHGDVVRWPVMAVAVGTVTVAFFLSLRHRRRDSQGVERDRKN